jgi:hypothetical protein
MPVESSTDRRWSKTFKTWKATRMPCAQGCPCVAGSRLKSAKSRRLTMLKLEKPQRSALIASPVSTAVALVHVPFSVAPKPSWYTSALQSI